MDGLNTLPDKKIQKCQYRDEPTCTGLQLESNGLNPWFTELNKSNDGIAIKPFDNTFKESKQRQYKPKLAYQEFKHSILYKIGSATRSPETIRIHLK